MTVTDLNTVKATFYLTYVLLVTTGTITFIEALRNKNPYIRHIMNLETCISVVAAFFYSQFVKSIQESHGNIDYKSFTNTRYLDWTITTPMMLISLLLALGQGIGITSIPWLVLFPMIFFNYGMIYAGYLGETGRLPIIQANMIGFMFFVLLFGLIYIHYIQPKYLLVNTIVFYTYVILWGLYGIAYFAKDELKNRIYNVLDMCAKCLMGIFLWLYFTGIVTL